MMLFLLLASTKSGGNGTVSEYLLFWFGIALVVVNLRAAAPWPMSQNSARALRSRRIALVLDVCALPVLALLSLLVARQPYSAHEFHSLALPNLIGVPILALAVAARASLSARS